MCTGTLRDVRMCTCTTQKSTLRSSLCICTRYTNAYVCSHVRICVHTCVSSHVLYVIYVCVHVCGCWYTYVHMYVCSHVCMFTCMYVHIYVCVQKSTLRSSLCICDIRMFTCTLCDICVCTCTLYDICMCKCTLHDICMFTYMWMRGKVC